MPTWLNILLAVLAAVCASLAPGLIGALRDRRRLGALFFGRDQQQAIESCAIAFNGIEEARIRLAYAWVQELVNYPSAPLQLDDDLLDDLRIDQGDIDDMFESAQEWRGRYADDRPVQSTKLPSTVAGLMAEILAFGYEGYVDALKGAKQNAA